MKFALLFATGTILALAQHPEATREGRELFLRNCSACHGDTAKGGRAPDLTSGEWKHGGNIEDLVRNIVKGIPGTQMPPIGVSDVQARSIIDYLLSLSASGNEKATGDEAKGRVLFFGSGKCSGCHMFAGRGGIYGSDLTNVRGQLRPSVIVKRMGDSIETVELPEALKA